MRSQFRFLGHPVHPMLVVFPLGLLGGAIVFDITYLIDPDGVWGTIAFYLIPLGLVFGILAGLAGFVDWLNIPSGTRAKATGLVHALVNLTMLVLFAISAWLRWDDPAHPHSIDMVFSLAGAMFATIGGWLGGELVYRMGVGVESDANVNKPLSTPTSPETPDARHVGY